jgi:hypothetical protein
MSGILFIGDSHTWAGQVGITSSFANQLGGVNLGWSGAMSGTVLLDFGHKIQPYLTRSQRVSVLLGTNDALFNWDADQYRKNLECLVVQLGGDGRRIWIHAPWHTSLAWGNLNVNAATMIVNDMRLNNPNIEPQSYLGVYSPPDLKDAVHPSQDGHNHLASIFGPILGVA